MIRRQNHCMRSSLGTRRLKTGQMQKRAFIQRVNAMVCPFGVERETDTEKPFHTLLLSTKPDLAAACCGVGCQMHSLWVCRSRAHPPPPSHNTRAAPAAGGREGPGRATALSGLRV